MERIDSLLFGYRRVRVPREKMNEMASLLLRLEISARLSAEGEFSVREKDFPRFSRAAVGMEYEASELLGATGAIRGFPYKLGLLVGVLASLLLAIFSSSVIWDVRIEGNEALPSSLIEYELAESGLLVGGLWASVDRSDAEASVLGKTDGLAWININRRGGVAYVVVAEKSGEEPPSVAVGYSNIVARCDCVIEEISVKRGVAMVQVGDAVKRGDLLISGVVPEASGGGFCRAEGSVVGRISDRVSVSVDREYEKITDISYSHREIAVKIFNFTINIFKRYGNSDPRCDIIKEIQTFSLPGGASLPLQTAVELVAEKKTVTDRYDDARLVRLCAARLQSATALRTVNAELIKIRTFGDYTERGYEMHSDIVLLTEVGESLPFEVEE